MACEMHTMSCGTTRRAPRCRCPTSLLPICPAGSPTAKPDALRSVRDAFAQRRCQVGVSPSSMALPSRPGRKPQPSSTTRTTGVRGPCLFAILRAMQSSRALHALPVVVCLSIPALGAPLAGQAGYRITSDGAWFFQEAAGGHADPARVRPLGNSAGANLSVLAAYAMGEPQLPPPTDVPAVTVRRNVNLYGP